MLLSKGAEDSTNSENVGASNTSEGKKKTLLERIGEFDKGNEADGYKIAHFPPKLKAVACKPIFFDTAWKCLDFPDLSEETVMPVEKKKETKNSGVWGYLGY